MSSPRILVFSGSAREQSYNQRLAAHAADRIAEHGGVATLISLRDYPMPLFNQDEEARQGPPAAATRLKQVFVEHDALLISAPEYNGSITPLLKNTLDWLSRRVGDEPSLLAYRDKVAALVSASPGRLGGLRGLVHVRQILNNLGVNVLASQFALSGAAGAFDDGGKLQDERAIKSVDSLARELVATAEKFGG